jgi:hypothetical protein
MNFLNCKWKSSQLTHTNVWAQKGSFLNYKKYFSLKIATCCYHVPKEMTESVTQLRKDVQEKFPFLRNRDEMKHQIGKLISLPRLSRIPKGFEEYSSTNSFLLTQQRFDLYKEMDDFAKQTSDTGFSAGFVPSGPHGIGKSGIGYLLACYAFANNHLLIYIVS